MDENFEVLWMSVLDLCEHSYNLGGEGNSGEFHEDEEEERLRNRQDAAFSKMRRAFINATGYTPVLECEGVYMSTKTFFQKCTERYAAYNQTYTDYWEEYYKLPFPRPEASPPNHIELDKKLPVPKAIWVFTREDDIYYLDKTSKAVLEEPDENWSYLHPNAPQLFDYDIEVQV